MRPKEKKKKLDAFFFVWLTIQKVFFNVLDSKGKFNFTVTWRFVFGCGFVCRSVNSIS